MSTVKLRLRKDRPATIEERRELLAEIERLKEELKEFTELKEYAKSLNQETYLELHAKNERLLALLKPFSDMAGELFARNWNNNDVVVALDNPNDPHRLTARDFFAIRITLNG